MKKLLPLLFALFVGLPAFAQPISHDRPIHDAARTGTGEEVSKLLKADPRQRDVRTELGSTPLHLAAMNPDTSALKVLIAAKADPNARDNEGATPLHMAAYGSRTVHTQLLLEAGAQKWARLNIQPLPPTNHPATQAEGHRPPACA